MITVDPSIRYQTIEGWGTSLVFWGRPAGPDSPYHDPRFIQAYARDLGCNILRIQCNPHALKGPSGRLDDPVELGQDLDENIAKFDFGHERVKIFGQVAGYLRDNALEPERVVYMADFWSPPHWMKEPTGAAASFAGRPARRTPFVTFNGTDTVGGRLAQTPENLQQFARYVAAWTTGFERTYGITFDNLSLQNEISFENPFDSCTYLHRAGPDTDGDGEPDPKAGQYWQYAAALKAVKDEFARLGISKRIRGPHMAEVGEKPDNPWALNDQCRFIQAVKEHEDPELIDSLTIYTSNYLDPHWSPVMLQAFREGKDAMPDQPWAGWLYCPGFGADGKQYWIAEMGGARAEWLNGPGGTPGNGAIRVAQNMHNALVWGHAGAYVYWQALDDGRATPGGGSLLGNTFDVAGKKAAAFRHFSRCVRPGAVRVSAVPSALGGDGEMDTGNSLNVSAFVHDADRTLTVVLVSMLPESRDVQINASGAARITVYDAWRTSADESFTVQPRLQPADGRLAVTVPPYSVVTLHGTEGAEEGRTGDPLPES
jgi:O-glycosyl hydrolase